MFRGPIRLFSVVLFACAVISGFVIKNFFEIKKNPRFFHTIICIVFSFSTICLIFSIFFSQKLFSAALSFLSINFVKSSSVSANLILALNSSHKMIIRENLIMYLSIFTLSILLIKLIAKSNFLKKIALLLLIFLIIFEYSFFIYKLIPINDLNTTQPDKTSIIYQTLKNDKTNFRIKYASPQVNIKKNFFKSRLRNIEGYQNIISQNTAFFQCFVNNSDNINKIVKSNRLSFDNYLSNKFALSGVKYLISSRISFKKQNPFYIENNPIFIRNNAEAIFTDNENEVIDNNLELIVSDTKTNECLYRYKNYLPLFFPVRQIILDNEYNSLAFDKLSAITDYKNTALVNSQNYGLSDTEFKTENCSIEKIIFQNDEINVLVKNTSAQFIVSLEPYNNDWKLYEKGKLQTIYRTNQFFRGFYLQPGEHSLTFLYKPIYFYAGILLSLIGVIILYFLIIFLNRFGEHTAEAE